MNKPHAVLSATGRKEWNMKQYERWQVVTHFKMEYAPAGHLMRHKYFNTKAGVEEYIKSLDKEKYVFISVYKLDREYNSGEDF